MSFAQEMKDFVGAYSQMTNALNNQQILRINRDKWRGPSDPDLAPIYSPFEHPDPNSPGVGSVTLPKITAGKPNQRQLLYRKGIQSIESGGNYKAVGPETKGDHGYGAYQIMGKNVGPWTKDVLGQALTPHQFLASPEAQDAVFDAKFGQYVNQFGEKGAAEAWFGGPGSVGKTRSMDVNRTTVGGYGDRFMQALGGKITTPSGVPDQKSMIDIGAIPDDTEQPDNQPVESSPDDSGDQQDQIDTSVNIDVPELAPATAANVALVPTEEQDLTYEEGGVIPDDTEYFQGGGMPMGTYNPPQTKPTQYGGFSTPQGQQLATQMAQKIQAARSNPQMQGAFATAYGRGTGAAQGMPTGISPNVSFQQWAGRNPAPQGTDPNANTRNQAGAMPRGGAPSIQKDDYGSWRNWGAGGTPMQQTYRAGLQKPVVEPPPPTAPAAQPKKYSFDPNSLNNLPNRIAPLYRTQAKQIMDAYNQANPNGDDPVAFMRAQDAINKILSRGAQGYYGGSGGGGSSYGGGGGGGGYSTSGREEGGMVHEEYARGGPVRTSQTPRGKMTQRQFDELVRLQARGVGGGQRVDQNQQARDRAARMANIREGRTGGGATSSAYRPAAPVTPHPTAVGLPQRPVARPRQPVTAGGQVQETVPVPHIRPEYLGATGVPSTIFEFAPDKPVPVVDPQGNAVMRPNPAPPQTQTGPQRPAIGSEQEPDITAPEVAPEEANPYPYLPQFARGGAIPDDEPRYARGGYTTSATGKRSSALPGRTTKGAAENLGAGPWGRDISRQPKVKDARKVRVRPMKGRGAAKRRSRPEAAGVPVPTQRPEPKTHWEIGSPNYDPNNVPTPTPRPDPNDFPQPTNPNVLSTQPYVERATPDRFIGIDDFSFPGSNAPPDTGAGPAQLQPRIPGVNPSVPGYDVPQGGTWSEPYLYRRGGMVPYGDVPKLAQRRSWLHELFG
jgi:hypothetical protein